MKERPLGNTGINVSEIAFGGVEIGMPYGIGINSEKDMLQEKEAIHLLHKALDKGINFFDTARMYGQSEAIIGKAFVSKRNEVVIGSKCSHFRDSQCGLPSPPKIRKIILSSIEQSLSALKTDYLDLYMLHQSDLEILQHEEIAKTFESLKQKGVVKSIGVSTYSTEETALAIESGVWEVIQLPFNLMDQRQGKLFTRAKENGIGMIVRSVLLKGLLSDRGKGLSKPLMRVEKHICQYKSLMDTLKVSLPSLAIKFALSFPEVSSVLVGIDKEEYLQQALLSGNGKYMGSEDLKLAKDLAFSDPEFINLPFWDKMGWLT